LAAIVYQAAGFSELEEYADTLRARALAAWNWLETNPGYSYYNNNGFNSANPELSEYGQFSAQVGAAVALFALTGEEKFKNYVDANYANIQPMLWTSWYPYESTIQDLLLFYAHLPGISATVSNTIKSSFIASMANSQQLMDAILNKRGGYRAYLYEDENGWGSNRTRCNMGNLFFHMVHYSLDLDPAQYRDAAIGHLNFIHGTNPISVTMLTNMSSFGAENSADEIYHAWFAHGTDYDNASTSLYGPPPGYLTGGFNKYFAPDPSYGGNISPPQNQPPLKSYKDWNTSWPENSWEVTEPSISYQAAYLRLLSRYVTSTGCSRYVSNGHDVGSGSFRNAVDCSLDGDTILFHSQMHGDTVILTSSKLSLHKNLVILSSLSDSVFINGMETERVFDIGPGTVNIIKGMHLINGNSQEGKGIHNEGTTTLEDLIFYESSDSILPGNSLLNGGIMIFKGATIFR
jgi:hypothetical protein